MAVASSANQQLGLIRGVARVKDRPHQFRLCREGVITVGVVNLRRLHPIGAFFDDLRQRLLIAVIGVPELGRGIGYRREQIAMEHTRLAAVDVDAPIFEAAKAIERPEKMLRELLVGHRSAMRTCFVALCLRRRTLRN